MILVIPLKKTWTDEAREAAVVARRNKAGKMFTARFFAGKNTTGLPHGVTDEDTVERTVKIKDLAPTQQHLDLEGLDAYLRGEGYSQGKLPIIVEHQGQQLIAEGHHRLAADLLAGKSTAKVLYAKTKTFDPATWTATFEKLTG